MDGSLAHDEVMQIKVKQTKAKQTKDTEVVSCSSFWLDNCKLIDFCLHNTWVTQLRQAIYC